MNRKSVENVSAGTPTSLTWQRLAPYPRVRKVEGDVALVCGCSADCKCTIDAAHPAQCGCGKPIRKVSLKGTGIYFCNCGGSCTCNTVSTTPATCKCGMALKKVD